MSRCRSHPSLLVTGLMIVLLLAILTLTGCSIALQILYPTPTPTPEPICLVQAYDFLNQLKGYLAEWDDANALAQATARIALASPVRELQRIRRDVGNLAAPACAVHVRDLCVEYMDAIIKSYMAFMEQKSDVEVSLLFQYSNKALLAYTVAYSRLLEGQ